MLVYRRRDINTLVSPTKTITADSEQQQTSTNNTESSETVPVTQQQPQEDEDQDEKMSITSTEGGKPKTFPPTVLPPVENSEIPEPILEYLKLETERKEQKRIERERERNSVTMEVF